MKKFFTYIIIVLNLYSFSQTTIKPGDLAQNFILTLPQNGTQGVSMPFMKRIVLLHFWSTSVSKSNQYNPAINRLTKRYKNSFYKTADGFETIAIAVQSDKNAWMEAIKKDSLNEFINAIAVRGYNEDVCKKYGVTSLPTDILIDENGVIIAVNPKYTLVEELLDEKKNYQPEINDLSGSIALSSNSTDLYSFAKIQLSNAYGDSLGSSITDAKGKFTFNDVRMNQDFVITIDNKTNIEVSDPLALFNIKGDRILESKTINDHFVFYVPAQYTKKFKVEMEEPDSKIDQLNVNKYVSYKSIGSELAVSNEEEIKGIVDLLKKNQNFNLEYTCHASTKLEPKAAETLTQKHVLAIKNFFLKKGIPSGQIKGISKGNTSPINKCKSGNGASACNDGQHFLNQRTQFRIYKN